MARIHLKLFFVAKTMHMPCEKVEPRGNLAIPMLTIGETFAAGRGMVRGERIVGDGS